MAKVLRHQHGKQPQAFDVIAQNADGTVDIKSADGNVMRRCRISTDKAPGTVTLVAGSGDLPSVESTLPESARGDFDRKLGELIRANEALEKQSAIDEKRIKELEAALKAKATLADQLQKQLNEANKVVAAATSSATTNEETTGGDAGGGDGKAAAGMKSKQAPK